MERLYIYIIAHEYKHYIMGGTGLRSLLDRYVYLRAKQETMDWSYISAECQKLGIGDFEQQSRKLAQAVFGEGSAALSDAEEQMLGYYLKSGTCGTMKQFAQGKITRFQQQTGSTSRLKYLWYRLFPPMEIYERYYPFFYRNKLLLPVGWGYRLIRGMVKNRKRCSGK